jgi:demethylmenaquinone methyltransferase / 2-methoxy-6-polyprenyl-1,4-benzoquinol methylase
MLQMLQKDFSDFPLQEYYSRIYKTYDLVNRLFTFGQDKRWRLQTVKTCLREHPRRLLDLCCGTGDLALGIAREGVPDLNITGFDLNSRMLALAKDKANALGMTSIEFLQGDAAFMPFMDQEFDCITIGFGFRNLTWENPHCEKHLREIRRVMKPGAKLLILESASPENPFIGLFYRLYLRMILIPLGGLFSGDWKAYRYLAGSSSGFFDFATLRTMLEQYGLRLEMGRKYLFGTVNLLIATKKGT